MCSRRVLRWSLAMCIGAAALHAQSAADLRERVRRLDAAHRDALARAAHADSLRTERLDTVAVGHLLLLSPPNETHGVQAAANEVWPKLDSLFGDEAGVLATHPLLFWRQSRSASLTRPEHAGVDRVVVDSTATRQDVGWQLAIAASAVVIGRADTALRGWLSQTLFPIPHGDVEPTRVYVELATAPAQVVRRCFLGDLSWCREALGLVAARDPLDRWYTALERRDLIARLREVREVRLDAGRRDRCLRNRDDGACLAELRSLPPQTIPVVLTNAPRHALARFAIHAGGRGAYSRLVRSAGRPLDERLAAAAGTSADSLLSSWRASVVAARPRNVTLTPASAWTGLLWATAFALIGLRSSRWR